MGQKPRKKTRPSRGVEVSLSVMFRGIRLKLLAAVCIPGLFSGVLLADGTFINFRGEEVRKAIEDLEGA